MAGIKQPQKKLNHTLNYITKLLIQYKITNWFIAYGTLLGIIRNGTCIDSDDDVDIVCDRVDFERIHKVLKAHNIPVTYNYGIGKSNKIIKTVKTDVFTSIDFYCATVGTDGHFHDDWENVIWTNCYIPKTKYLPSIKWNTIWLPVPNNYVQKLKNRYGKNWKIPQNTKGPMPRKRHL